MENTVSSLDIKSHATYIYLQGVLIASLMEVTIITLRASLLYTPESISRHILIELIFKAEYYWLLIEDDYFPD